MLHENLQAHVVREDRLPRARARGRAVHARGHVRRRRVQFRQKETRLTTALVADDVPRDREAIGEQFLQDTESSASSARVAMV